MTRSALPVALFALCLACATSRAEPPFGNADPFAKGKDALAPAAGRGKPKKAFAERAEVELSVSPERAKWGETVTVKLTIIPNAKAHSWTYPAFPKDSSQLSRNLIELPTPGDLIFIGAVTDPAVEWKIKPRDETEPKGPQDQYTDKPVTWEFKAVVSPKAKAGKAKIDLSGSSLQACDAKNCYSATGKELPTATVEVLEGASDRVKPEDLAAALAILNGRQQVIPVAGGNRGNGLGTPPVPSAGGTEKGSARKVAKPTEAYAEELKAIEASIVAADASGPGSATTGAKQGLGAFIATAALWGLISLVTPCVFPMIPITVSIFLKQAHGSFGERLKLAGVYCLTIISVLGLSAFALLKFMAWLSVHPVTNILLGLLFLVLALSLFGMYEIALPNSLQKRLQAKQSQGGVIGTVFGALAFTVISFTCVAPFLGGFAGISAGNDAGGSLIVVPTAKEIAGGLAFATAFAAPFFVLALVPGLMKALPRSGGWLDSVKVVMGFLELAAALKFLRNAELGLISPAQYFTYDVVLGGWVVISAACGLYLLNVFRLPHDEEKPSIGVPRLLFALLFLGLAIYLAPALFKGSDGKPQRPSGTVYAWVESFLLPDTSVGWRPDLKETLEAARQSGKPVFVDFTGVTCTNCKYNENNVFNKPGVAGDLGKFGGVQLYTDWLPETAYQTDPGFPARKAEALANRDFQNAVFKTVQLPLYAVLMPQADGKVKVVGVYDEGKINEPEKFAAFLKESQEKAKAKK
jgi:thiol:disulfide interchange protein DsbD